ncbi:MAG: TIGR02594 family protein [Planctomycetia bacterium]|nr:TIGR02594 family protein [Planctomycetia bacterium]
MSRWDQDYRALSKESRAAVNELVNELFRQKTGHTGKIDPHSQHELAARWLEIRDAVLANRQKFAQWLQQTSSNLVDFAAAFPIFALLNTVPRWIATARREIGTHEIAGAQNNPRIMEYIRTCANIQQTAAQRRYVETTGEDGVEWCSAFVNWCLRQAGIVGTDHALASSWENWGTKLSGPRQGAIVCFGWKSSHIDHVAFCDEVNGEFRMLGGNQLGYGGQVSSVRFSKHAAKHYRWPASA